MMTPNNNSGSGSDNNKMSFRKFLENKGFSKDDISAIEKKH